MDCSLPGSSVHGVVRVKHDLATKSPPPIFTLSGELLSFPVLSGSSPAEQSSDQSRQVLAFQSIVLGVGVQVTGSPLRLSVFTVTLSHLACPIDGFQQMASAPTCFSYKLCQCVA